MKTAVLLNETDLLCLVSGGDEAAFRKIFDFYSDRLFSYVRKITDHDEIAEEIVMDAFMKIWINRESLSNINRFDAYLYAIVRNQSFNALKRVARESQIIKEMSFTHTEYQDTTEEAVIYNDYRHLLHQTVDQLPPQQRRIYILSSEKGLKCDEIADQLNISRNTVKAHLKKAVCSVRTAFSNYLAILLYVCLANS